MHILGRGIAHLFIILLLLSMPVYAQLGEFGGALRFNVSVGSSQTLNWTVTNSGDVPISFQVTQAAISPVSNVTTPTLAISPMNGSIPAHSQLPISVTIAMPSSNRAGVTWTGIAVALGQISSPSSGAGGAVISAGIGKNFVIVSAPPRYNFVIIGSIVALILLAIGGFFYYKVTHTPEALRASKQRAKENAARKLRELELKYKEQKLKLSSARKLASQSRKPSGKAAKRKGTKKAKPKVGRGKSSRRR